MLKKKLSTAHVKMSFFIFAGLMLVSFPVTAQADAIYTASGTAQIGVIGFRTSSGASLPSQPSALTLTSQVLFLTPNFTSSGNASTTLSGIAFSGGGSLIFQASASGQAGADAGFASSSFQMGGTVILENSSPTEGFFVDFVASLPFTILASFNPALNESAEAGFFLNIVTSSNLTVVFFDSVSPGFNATTFSTTFSMFVPAGGGSGFGAGFGIGGSAQVVPEPATILLLGTGLAGVAIKARKRLRSRKA